MTDTKTMHEHHWSQLKLARECPLKYVTRSSDFGGEPALRGIVAHKILDAYVDSLEGHGKDEELMEALISAHAGTPGLGGEEWDYLKHLLRRHAEEYDHRDMVGFDVHREKALRVIIDKAGSRYTIAGVDERTEQYHDPVFMDDAVLYAGRLDLLQHAGDLAVITDWKSDRAITSESSLKHDDQLRAYAVLAHGVLGVTQVKIKVHFLVANYTVEFDMDEDDIMEAAAYVHGLAKNAEALDANVPAGLQEPRPGSGCAYCHAADRCPAAPLGDQTATHVAAYPAVKAAYQTFEKRVKEVVKRHPVDLLQNERLDYATKERTLLRPDWINRMLQAHGAHDKVWLLNALIDISEHGKGSINGTAVRKWLYDEFDKEKAGDVWASVSQVRKHSQLAVLKGAE
jgi:hypothetical protein